MTTTAKPRFTRLWRAAQLMSLFADRSKLETMPVHDFVSAFVK